MIKKELLIPISVIIFSIIFAIISMFVFFSKGKSKYWLTKKMKIGAVLLSLSAMTIQNSCRPPFVTCYEQVMPNQIYVETDSLGNVNLNITESNKLNGKIFVRESDEFSYNITDTALNASVLFKGNISPSDGIYDSTEENFFIEIDTSISEGKYVISFYPLSIDLQNEYQANFVYNLKIEKN